MKLFETIDIRQWFKSNEHIMVIELYKKKKGSLENKTIFNNFISIEKTLTLFEIYYYFDMKIYVNNLKTYDRV